ncbi:hypothetical protein [Bacillus solitudinis]|uniref:hypothetical protein n=1 Tax=Bacillus solitudinis TaxID=2014074 RepID=UPI0018E2866E|nr:hypothetical protein [Bacillus solitudinis]
MEKYVGWFLTGNTKWKYGSTMEDFNFRTWRYISIEMIIEKTKESYYEVLEESSKGWHEGKNNYSPFVKYYLGVILSAYKEFSGRVETIRIQGLTKAERVRHIFATKLGKISKSEIATLCPDIGVTTIEKALSDLWIKVSSNEELCYCKKENEL